MSWDHNGLSKGPYIPSNSKSEIPRHVFPAEKKKTKKQVSYHLGAIADWYNSSSRVSFLAPCDDNGFGVRSVCYAAKMK